MVIPKGATKDRKRALPKVLSKGPTKEALQLKDEMKEGLMAPLMGEQKGVHLVIPKGATKERKKAFSKALSKGPTKEGLKLKDEMKEGPMAPLMGD